MPHPVAARPDSPEAMRAEIERTRARMSTTLDQIEDVLVEKTDRVRETVDVAAKVRQSPLRSVGIVAGIGLALGFLTGGKTKSKKPSEKTREFWEQRARRIMEIAREQEDEIDDLHRALQEVESEAAAVLENDYDDEDEEEYEDESDDQDEEIPFRDRVRSRAGDLDARTRSYVSSLDEAMRDRAEEMEDRLRDFVKKVEKQVHRISR